MVRVRVGRRGRIARVRGGGRGFKLRGKAE